MNDFLAFGNYYNPIHFDNPWLLSLVILVPLILLLERRYFGYTNPWHSFFLRGAFLALLIAAVAGPHRIDKPAPVEPLLIIDVSQSLSEAQKAWIVSTVGNKIRVAKNESVLAFAGTARETTWDSIASSLLTPPDGLEPEKTDIERVLQVLVRDNKPRSVILFTDGWETTGNAARLVTRLREKGIRIYPVTPPSTSESRQISIDRIHAPAEAIQNDPLEVAITLHNPGPGRAVGELSVFGSEQLLHQEKLTVLQGASLRKISIPLSQIGLIPVHATFTEDTAEIEPVLHKSEATAWVRISRKAKVLILSAQQQDNRYLENALKNNGLKVQTRVLPDRNAPSPIWSTHDSIIVNNINYEDLPASLREGIEGYVRQGGGFVMIGGEKSFGLGGYKGTSVETVLPVKSLPPQKEKRRAAVILIIDKSGSMRKRRKLAYAISGALKVSENLRDSDLFGVIGFDKTPFVVVPLDYVGKNRSRLVANLQRLKPGGGTHLLPALQEAASQLDSRNASDKHIIVLTDGETGGTGSDYLELASSLREGSKVAISTIAVGQQPNLRLLSRLADYGGGAFHHTSDPSNLPNVFLDTMRESPRETTMVEGHLRTISHAPFVLLEGLSSETWPSVKGYVQTTLKSEADADLLVIDQTVRQPLLASWHFGKGKTVAFTSDANGRWSAPWVTTTQYGAFWAHVVRWTTPSSGEANRTEGSLGEYTVNVGNDGGGLVVEVYFFGKQAHDNSRGLATATVVTPEKSVRVATLKNVAPGYFKRSIPVEKQGDYTVTITLPTGDTVGPFGYTLPPHASPEYQRSQPNLRLLNALAHETNGAINPRREDIVLDEAPTTRKSLLPFVILAAMVLYLLEIIITRAAANSDSLAQH